jgi:hypothetical protein
MLPFLDEKYQQDHTNFEVEVECISFSPKDIKDKDKFILMMLPNLTQTLSWDVESYFVESLKAYKDNYIVQMSNFLKVLLESFL